MALVLWELQSSGRKTAEPMICISIKRKMDVNSGNTEW